jgi:transposase InsO family protein
VSTDDNGLTRFVQWYNAHRPYRALKGISPSERLGRLQAALSVTTGATSGIVKEIDGV